MTIQNNGGVLAVENLSCAINGSRILDGISLSAEKCELIGLVGPNGAGKTTLLRCINGLIPFDGTISICGKPAGSIGVRETALKVAHMHQNTAVSTRLPAFDVVLMGRYPHIKRFRREGPRDYKAVYSSMEFTETLRFKDRPVSAISGGERQRVLFAKVLSQETQIILLDEPTASLDITHRDQIFDYCRELCGRGNTVICAVHDLKTAARYCTRLVLMKDGSIISDGKAEEVLTAQNMMKAYGVNALVYKNRITGEIDIHISAESTGGNGRQIHVIGGGGSASGIMRQLFEYGYKVTAGVFAHGDSDIQTAEVFGIEYTSCKPFSDISDEAFDNNVTKIKAAEITILCNMPFGRQNLKNLDAALHAGRLVIIEDESPEARDFTGGAALNKYLELRKRAVIVNSARLHEVL